MTHLTLQFRTGRVGERTYVYEFKCQALYTCPFLKCSVSLISSVPRPSDTLRICKDHVESTFKFAPTLEIMAPPDKGNPKIEI